MKRYTAVVLGAGPAGYNCAVRLAQLGATVAVVERDYLGGICINWGCTPSKAMIESAKVIRTIKQSGRYGIRVSGVMPEFSKIASRRDGIILKYREEIKELLEYHGIDIFYGEGHVLDKNKVEIHRGKLDLDGDKMDYSGAIQTVETDNIIFATGSKPLIPAGIDSKDPSVVSSNRLIVIKHLPEELTIVGGGIIGLEFATIFSNLGVKVTVIEAFDRVLNQLDPDISEEITSELENNGVKILTGHRLVTIKDGTVVAKNLQTDQDVKISSSLNLIAIGRKAIVDKGLCDNLGVCHLERGIEVDDYMKTNVDGIWAIGDATGKSILAHVGIQQGLICAENIMATQKGTQMRLMDYSVIPAIVYTLPEIAVVGVVPEDMQDVKVVKVPFAANLRAGIEDNSQGFVKLWIMHEKVLAAQMIGFTVSETVQEIANMIALGTNIRDVAQIIHAHPTYAEINRTALEHALGKCVDYHD